MVKPNIAQYGSLILEPALRQLTADQFLYASVDRVLSCVQPVKHYLLVHSID